MDLSGSILLGGFSWVNSVGLISLGGFSWVDLTAWILSGGCRWVDLVGWIWLGGFCWVDCFFGGLRWVYGVGWMNLVDSSLWVVLGGLFSVGYLGRLFWMDYFGWVIVVVFLWVGVLCFS